MQAKHKLRSEISKAVSFRIAALIEAMSCGLVHVDSYRHSEENYTSVISASSRLI